ncbi:hypothetical protein AVEN_116554-1 [Araneus ventricosus]|uniref:Uncharacterized protein n=1 Tax=Araneus ventricosus TaxID=182803 RepID=A0A4Y2S0U2_ARAVE|nr:hypothetical protein AVEN_116554-1 [Araneus ventricosus]
MRRTPGFWEKTRAGGYRLQTRSGLYKTGSSLQRESDFNLGGTDITRMGSRRISKRVPAFPEDIERRGVVTSTPITGRTAYGRSWAVAGDGLKDSNYSA